MSMKKFKGLLLTKNYNMWIWKFRFLGSDPKAWREELVKYMAEDQFPEKYGGILPDSKEVQLWDIIEWKCLPC